jgi:flagellar hook-length control protein FliK
MNATPSIFRAQSDDAGQVNARSPTSAAADQANTQDFAGALSEAGAKPVRTPRGRHLPAPGNHSPPATGLPVPTPGSTPPAKADVPVASQPAAPAATPVAGTAAPTGGPAQINNDTPQLVPVAADPAPPRVAGVPLPADGGGKPLADQTTAAAMPSLSSPPALSGATATSAAPATTPAKTGTLSPTLRSASAQPSQSREAKPPLSASVGKTATAAATSGGADAASIVSASAEADATAQAATAALAQNTRTPEADSLSPGEFATPDTSIAAQDIGVADSLPVAAPVAGAARSEAVSIAAAVTAASKASITLASSPTAVAGATDKHTRSNNVDALLSGASNDGSAGAAQLMTAGTATDATPAHTLNVAAAVDSDEFGQGVADRVSLLMDSNLTSAKLQVNPPALGPIEVRIALQGGHAQVWFTSHSSATRDALESSAPKLREMLGAQGFGQVSVDISQRSFQERSPTPRGYAATAASGVDAGVSPDAATSISRTSNGLLDAYA